MSVASQSQPLHADAVAASPGAALLLDLAKSVIAERGRENDLLRSVILRQQRQVEQLQLRLLFLASGAPR